MEIQQHETWIDRFQKFAALRAQEENCFLRMMRNAAQHERDGFTRYGNDLLSHVADRLEGKGYLFEDEARTALAGTGYSYEITAEGRLMFIHELTGDLITGKTARH